LQFNDEFDQAKVLYQKVLEIRERDDPDSPVIALDLNHLATVEGKTAHLGEAGALMSRALAILDKIPRIDDPQLAAVYHNYGVFSDITGDLLGSEASFERAVEIRERTIGPAALLTAASMQALGYERYRLGDYASARQLLDTALANLEKSPEQHEVAYCISNLALVMADMGRHDLSIAYQERAVSILRDTRGEEHSEYAQFVSELGMFLSKAGEYERAAALIRPALAAQEKKVGPVHQEVALTLLRLARAEAAAGDLSSAAGHYQRAIDIARKMFNEFHPIVGEGLDGLAHLKLTAGDLDEADRLFRKALEIKESVMGSSHPEVAELFIDIARTNRANGKSVEALRNSLQAEAILRRHFGQVIRGFSEREALAFQRIRQTGLEVALSVLAGTSPADRAKESVAEIWNALIRSRASVLDQVASRHAFGLEPRNEASAALTRQLAAAANRLATLVVQGPNPGKPEAYRARFEQALQAKEKLELELAEMTRNAGGIPPTSASVETIESALPLDTGLIAFVQFLGFTGPGPATMAGGLRRPAEARSSYGAFLMRRDLSGPLFFDLGDAAGVDTLISSWRRQAVPPPAATLGNAASEQSYRAAGERLRVRLWEPLAGHLKGLKRILIVPDGQIALVSFDALPSEEGKYLVEGPAVLQYLSTERDILKPPGSRSVGSRILAMGGPDFDVSPPAQAASLGGKTSGNPQLALQSGPPAYRGTASPCQDFQSLRFAPLPAAAEEVRQIQKQLRAAHPPESNATVAGLTAGSASEPSFKKWAPESSLLHLATHGFFLGEGCGAKGSGTHRSADRAMHEDTLHEGIFADNPLLLSGLALAGANQRSQAGPKTDDGILTSEEIASMDLSAAQLVVLSACETGVGEIQSGEGVLGLRRAFQLAGARTVIMSLWQVDDRATLDWMRRLYDGRGKGLSTAESVHQASLSALQERRAKGKSTHPFYWGAFVAAGDWR
ncbi:MAG TPA: CHAT domain-containing tetratricopeptide repeat protein, partial [Candidatus Polarisedimenticolia bacterium]|nr:CHAT domain-containing tetratricopeptide repeat protein [Candidatus Polarisedimenticolia bacterium]